MNNSSMGTTKNGNHIHNSSGSKGSGIILISLPFMRFIGIGCLLVSLLLGMLIGNIKHKRDYHHFTEMTMTKVSSASHPTLTAKSESSSIESFSLSPFGWLVMSDGSVSLPSASSSSSSSSSSSWWDAELSSDVINHGDDYEDADNRVRRSSPGWSGDDHDHDDDVTNRTDFEAPVAAAATTIPSPTTPRITSRKKSSSSPQATPSSSSLSSSSLIRAQDQWERRRFNQHHNVVVTLETNVQLIHIVHVPTVWTEMDQLLGEGERKDYSTNDPNSKVIVLSGFDDGNLFSDDGSSNRFGDRAYHEALVQPTMFMHEKPERVAIFGGGGECATLREVLKHNTVQEVTIIETDNQILIDVIMQHVPHWCDCSSFLSSPASSMQIHSTFYSCFDDPRVEIIFAQDAVDWIVDEFADEDDYDIDDVFDVIIMDGV